eukprot:3332421-Alexandrium_andersonii.AAC.1
MGPDTGVDILQQSDMGLAYAMFDFDTEQMLRVHRDRHDPGLALSFERTQRGRVRALMANWPSG